MKYIKMMLPGSRMFGNVALGLLMILLVMVSVSMFQSNEEEWLIPPVVDWSNSYEITLAEFQARFVDPPPVKESLKCPLLFASTRPGTMKEILKCPLLFINLS